MGLLPLELDGAPFSAEGLKSTKRVGFIAYETYRKGVPPFLRRGYSKTGFCLSVAFCFVTGRDYIVCVWTAVSTVQAQHQNTPVESTVGLYCKLLYILTNVHTN